MRLRIFILAALCGVMVWGGYQASVLRAGTLPAPTADAAPVPPGDVLAAAGPGVFASPDDKEESSGAYRISALSVFSNVALHVKDNYVDPARIDPKEMLVGALDEIERQIAEVLVEDLGGGKVRVSVPGHNKEVTVGDVESLWEINLKLREVFRFFEKYLPPQKDMRLVEYAAINGALGTLDPHSVLLKPEAFAEMKTSTKGEFGGLGIVISVREGKLTIISPLDGTPASRAGLRAMDVISRIGDVSTVSMPIEEAVRMLRGPEGSKVTIWVERKGWTEARKYTLTRQRIKIESVESELLADRVGYVKVKNFQQNTGRDLEEHIEKLEKKAKAKLKGLVLDLRNNPGGLLEQAIKVSDKFVSSGDIVTTVGYGNKLREPKRAAWSTSDIDTPVVVLVNNGSASASEIVAGALKNLDRGLILGQRTFGKGSVQVLYDFADSSALKLTIAQYLTPGNISIQSVGVAPDVALDPAWVEEKALRLFYEMDTHREKSLTKHLERAKRYEAEEEAKPEFTLQYLVEAEEDPSTNEEGEEEPPPTPKFREDYPTRLAREILVAAGDTKRSEMLKKLRKQLELRRAEEEKKISAAIGKLGVDWAANPGPAPSAETAIRASLRLEGTSEPGVLAAGEETKLVAEVVNQSETTLYRVHGHIETDHPAFKGREFLFGKLAPGETRKWEVSAKIPKEASSRSDILSLQVSAGDVVMQADARLPVTTQYVPHPQFAYAWSLDDEERGDGDGVLEPGEGVEFAVFVTNVGPGAADKVSLRLKSGAGEDLFLEGGRAEIGAIGPGETKVGLLKFNVRKNQTPGKTELPLELTIYDPSTGEWLEDELAVSPQPAQKDNLVKKAGSGQANGVAQIRAAADPAATVIGTIPDGAKVEWDAKNRGFHRVVLGEHAYGWVHQDQVRSGRGKSAPIAHLPARRPPVIRLDGKLGGRVVTTDSVQLSGQVSGRSLRDMYVVLNDKKVFYAPGPTPPAAPASAGWAPPDDTLVKLPFSHTLPLKDGLNKVLIVARLDERVVTYRSLFVSRVTDDTPKVAEATPADSTPKPSPATP